MVTQQVLASLKRTQLLMIGCKSFQTKSFKLAYSLNVVAQFSLLSWFVT